MKLPNSIISALRKGETSLGEHPAFPPEEEEKFIVYLVSEVFDNASSSCENCNIESMRSELSKMLSKAMSLEQTCKETLEHLCEKVINSFFDIPDDTVEINVFLVDKIDTKSERLVPEKTKDFTFDSISDMEYLTDEIYKRRFVNALVAGAAMFYANKLQSYVSELFEINPELPALYKKILDYNTILLYADYKEESSTQTDGGNVTVTLKGQDIQPSIEAKALLFPILVSETIKGILELAALQGLPNDRKKAMYVISKADFKLAEVWDMRLGYALWTLIEKRLKDIEVDIKELGINLFLMELSKLKSEDFNEMMREVLCGTRTGKEMLEDMCDEIQHNKDKDEFDNYINANNSKVNTFGDDDYFTSDELLTDDMLFNRYNNDDDNEEEYYTSEELLADDIQFAGEDGQLLIDSEV